MIEQKDGAIIEVSDLSKYYDKFLALDRISFTVGKGEIFGFLGPNGAGKTTTIKILIGLAKPSGGTARINGKDIIKDIGLCRIPVFLSIWWGSS